MTVKPPTQLPLRKGVNLAPLKPLLEIRDNQHSKYSHYLADACKERYEHYISQDKQTWRDLITTGQIVSLFIQGKQNLRYDTWTKSFYSVPSHQDSNNKVTPIMGFYALNCESRYITSNPDITVTSASEDDRSIQAAKAAKIIVDHYENKLYTNWHNIHEGLLLMSFGTNINRIRWDSGKEGLKALTEIFEDKEFPISQGIGQCLDCGHSGNGEEYLQTGFAVCPNCGSQNAYAEPSAKSLIPTVTGHQTHNLGDICLKALEFPACRWDLRYKAEESSWFIYEEVTNLGVIQQYLGNIKLPEDKGENSFGLEVVESLAKEGLAINGTNSTNLNEKKGVYAESVKISEMSLSASDLAGIKVRGDERTVDGQSLPKDADMSELFPDGCTVVGLNGMKVILGIYAETHKEELTTGNWHIRPFSGAGRGHSDAVEIQRRRNEADSQGYLAMRHNATPATFFAEGAVDEGMMKHISKPDVGIPINLENFPNARSITDLIASPRIGQVDAGLMQYFIQNLENMMQLTMGVTTFSGGLPGVDNDTATGARISDANAEAIFAPMLALKVDVRKRAAEIFVNLYRENVPVEQFFPLEKKYGSENGKWLSGADIQGELIFSVTKNSELSRNRWTVIEDNQRFMMQAGGFAGALQLKQADPEFFDEMCRRYGVEIEGNHSDETAQICRQRFQYAKKLIEQFLQINMLQAAIGIGDSNAPSNPDQTLELQSQNGVYQLPEEDSEPSREQEAMAQRQNAEAQLQQIAAPPQPMMSPIQMQAMEIVANLAPPISVYELNHIEKAKWFSMFLDSDEGREMDGLTREVVFKLIESHFQNGMMQQQIFAQMQGQVAVAQNAPGMAAEVVKNKAMGNRDDFTGQ